jgi:hypothetical protein
MKKTKVDFSGIWPLVEEYELREKAKKLGYTLQKDTSKSEKLVIVIKEFAKATNNLRYFLFSTFIVASNWSIVIDIIGTFVILHSVYAIYYKRK